MGSGETAPSMTKVHRALLARLDPVRAVALDTSYAFQANVPQMTEKIVDYFATSLNLAITPLHYGSYENMTPLEGALFRHDVREANYVFAGPGSPSYALSQWRAVDVASELEHVVDNGGVVCFASAAALTLGAYTAPIYEIYKAGADPHWLPGLDLLSMAGLNCAVIPHYDNAEGGNYDTRFCYLGEERLLQLESDLDDDASILGIDEHTAAIVDIENSTITVVGRANAYWRSHGTTIVVSNGTTVAMSSLSNRERRLTSSTSKVEPEPTDIEQLVARAQLPGTEGLEAIALLARRAATSNSSTFEPTDLIESLIALREESRQSREFKLADRLRDILIDSDVVISDGPDGPQWSLSDLSR